MKKEEKIKKLLEFKNLLNEDEDEEDDDRQILFDDFVQGLVSRLTAKDTSDLTPDDLEGSIKKHSMRKMFKADDEDEYYNYKNRYYKAPNIANSVMPVIQNGPDRADQMGNPKFVDYANVSQDMTIFEKDGSTAGNHIMKLASEYKKLKEGDGEDQIEEFFQGMPGSLKKKIEKVSENLSREKLEEFGNENDIEEGVSESELREKVREILGNVKKK